MHNPTSSVSSLDVLAIIHETAHPLLPFAHALRIVCAARSSLEVLDVRRHRHHSKSPGIRNTLAQWNMLPPDASRDDVSALGIRVKKTVKGGDFKKIVDRELSTDDRPDMLVVGTAQRRGLGILFGADLVDHLASAYRQTTLYVPDDANPFVDPATGAVSLKRILLPLAPEPSPESSIHMLRKLVSIFPGETPTILAVHIGDSFPPISPVLTEGLAWEERTVPKSGESIPHRIAELANAELADLIIMTTQGRDTLSQKFIGSMTEQVLRRAPCPVLAVAVS